MLDKKQKYLQIALNSTLEDAFAVIKQIPADERIIIEAGTPLIKTYGIEAVERIKFWWRQRVPSSYIVADLKCMDRGEIKRKIKIPYHTKIKIKLLFS